MRKLSLLVLAVNVTIIGFSQNQLSFEVVSVRPCEPDARSDGMRPTPGGERYIANCGPLRPIIWTSYWLQPDQVVGGPNWIDRDRWYIEGVAPRPSSIAELHIMMRNALLGRFNLQSHREKKEIEAYVLGLDKNGPKNLREHPPTNASDFVIDQKREGLDEKWTARAASMDFFVWRLGLRLGRPVVEQTGLRAGGYDFELSFTNDPPPVRPGVDLPAPTPLDLSGPNIFEALRSQLGLRLDAQKAPVDVLVIDNVERPSEN
jgi:uncharacterized protein (TIGR03435 family)